MPLPVPDPTISSTAVTGTPISEALFPRRQGRRFAIPQSTPDRMSFEKRSAETLDYSADLSRIMEEGDYILAAYGWSDDAEILVVAQVRFASKGIFASVFGGIDGETYQLSLLVKTYRNIIIQIRADVRIDENASDAVASYRPPLSGSPSDPAQAYLTDVLGVFLAPSYVDALGDTLFP